MDDNISALNEKYSSIVLPNTVLMSCGIVAGVFGNVTILIVYIVHIDDKKGDRYFIPILAFIDGVGSISNGLFYVIDNFYIFNFPSEILCRVLLFALTFASGFSGHVLGAIALQRYRLICHPYGKQLTLFRRRLAVIVITFACIIYGTPLLIISGVKTSQTTFQNKTFVTNMCVFDVDPSALTVVYFGSFLLLTTANIITTSVLYILIMKMIYKTLYEDKKLRKNLMKNLQDDIDRVHINGKDDVFNICIDHSEADEKTRKISVGSNFSETKRSEHRLNIRTKINVMFMIIIVFYALSYVPSIVILILTYTLKDFYYLQLPENLMNVWIFFARFLLLNHIVNPLIYGYFDVKLRSKVTRMCCLCTSDNGQQSPDT
jgi:hypothetical protein